MSDQPLALRLKTHHALLVAGWEAYLDCFVPSMLSGVYSPAEQADMALQSLGIAAGRWAANPDKRAKALSVTADVQRMRKTIDDGRDPVRPSMIESMLNSFLGAFQHIGAEAGIDEEIRAMLVPLHLSAIRVAAPRVFAAASPAAAVLTTLDQHLREHLPTGCVWMNGEAIGM